MNIDRELKLQGTNADSNSKIEIDVSEYFLQIFDRKKMTDNLYELINQSLPSTIVFDDEQKISVQSINEIKENYKKILEK